MSETIASGAACLIELLLMDGSEAAVVTRGRLREVLADWNALVVDRVWVPEPPSPEKYTNANPAVWLQDIGGLGPDENGEDSEHEYIATCLGGTSSGVNQSLTAETLARQLCTICELADGVRTSAGIITYCTVQRAPIYGWDAERQWPFYKVEIAIDVGRL